MSRPAVRVLVVGTATWVVFTAAAGLRPFGVAEISGWGLVGALLVWLLIAFTVDRIFARVPAVDSVRATSCIRRSAPCAPPAISFFWRSPFPLLLHDRHEHEGAGGVPSNPSNLAIDFSQGIGRVLVGYVEVLTRYNFGRYIFNSTFVAIFTVVITLVPAILGAIRGDATAFSRSRSLVPLHPADLHVSRHRVGDSPLQRLLAVGIARHVAGSVDRLSAMTIPVALYMLRVTSSRSPKISRRRASSTVVPALR